MCFGWVSSDPGRVNVCDQNVRFKSTYSKYQHLNKPSCLTTKQKQNKVLKIFDQLIAL